MTATPETARSETDSPDAGAPPTVRTVLALALPVVLANAAVPLQGAIDTAIIGNLGDTTLLAAIALGASGVILVFSSCNFLQMGISGTTAQAFGAGRPERVVDTLMRGVILALGAAALIILLKPVLLWALLALFAASDAAETAAAAYIRIRLWGAPFELMNYALMGWFTGLGLTRRLFELQLIVSIVNVTMTLILVVGLGWGIEGVAIGTIIGHATACAWGGWQARRQLAALMPGGYRPDWRRLFRGEEIGALLTLNRDIFMRTMLLSFSFAWVTRLGSIQGDEVLAANGVLMEFFFVTSHACDGITMAAESLVGRAIGARSPARLRIAVRVCAIAAALFAVGLSLVLAPLGEPIVALFTNVEEIREVAGHYVLWAAFFPVAGIGAFLMDGIFIGAADGRTMRNAMVVSAGLFLPSGWLMTMAFGNHGLWAAVWGFLLLRALTLYLAYPALEARVAAASTSAPTAASAEA